jgi:serine/threonine protein kinase/tetratricopeptide (TPR) repeat protein
MMPIAAGTKIGRYAIRSKLGEGGMGEVYLALDTKLDRKVALKILPAELASNEDRMRRFVQEAKAASALNHPNIITIHEIDETDSGDFIASEFIDGETLRERMRRDQMNLIEVLDVATQIASALVAAHAAGIVHRDIKPDNLMLRSDGIVKVLDFGLAKLSEPPALADGSDVDGEAPTRANLQTEPGRVMGTVAYMSPEQARGMELDARTDVWSLGVVLYRMVTGRAPFTGETPSHVTVSILEHEPRPLARFAPDVPAEFQRIVRKCLTKKRDERYQTARDLMIDLKSLRRELDFQSELERSATPHKVLPTAAQTGEGTPMQTLDRVSGAPTKAVNDAVATSATGARQTSSVEHVLTEIRRHKKVAILIAALVTIGVVTSILFIRSRGTRALTEKDTILLTDFVNITGDADFDGTLKQALAVQLGQSPFLNIFSEDRVRGALRFMGRPPEERVTRDVGREICERQGLKAMLTGSIAGLGNHYVITLEMVNAQMGDAMAREQIEAENKEQVLRALGEAATKLREKSGESLASIQKFDAPIEQATTPSLEAFKAFSLGVEQQLNGKYFDAIPLFKRAAEIDPNFALAYARLASVYRNSGEYGLAGEASQKAYDLRDRVSERERLFISMSYYSNATRELEKYIETLELWARTYPRDTVPHNNLALQYNDIGQYEKAVAEAREAIRLNPNAAPPYSNLARAFTGMNRFDEAKEVIRQALGQKVESIFMHRILYSIAFIEGDDTAMKQQIEWTNGKPEEYTAQNWQAETAAFLGQLRKAKEFSSRAAEMAQRRDLKEVVAQIVAGDAARDALFGDCKSVKDKTAKALAIEESQPARVTAANALAACGEFNQMQATTDDLAKSYPKDTVLNKVFLPLIQASAEMRRGNAAQAVQLLETTSPYEGAAFFQIAYLRGQAYLSQQKGWEAAREFQKILDHRGWQPATPLYSLAQLGLARAAILQGDTAKARKTYQDFFALWKESDADLPMLVEAKREYEKLR